MYYIGYPGCTYFTHEIPNKSLFGISYINIRNLSTRIWVPVYIVKLGHIVEKRLEDKSISPQMCTRRATDAMVRLPQTGFGLRDDHGDECVSPLDYLHARFRYLITYQSKSRSVCPLLSPCTLLSQYQYPLVHAWVHAFLQDIDTVITVVCA